MSLVYKLWSRFTRSEKISTIFIVLLGLCASIAELISIGLLLPIASFLLDGDAFEDLTSDALSFVSVPIELSPQIVIFLFGGAVLIAAAVRTFVLHFTLRKSFEISSRLVRSLFEEFFKIDFWQFQDSDLAKYTANLSSRSVHITYHGVVPFLSFVSNVVFLIATCVVLVFITGGFFVLAGAVIAAVYLAVIRLVSKRLTQISMSVNKKTDRTQRLIQNSFQSFLESKLSDKYRDALVGEFANEHSDLYRAQADSSFLSTVPRYWVEALTLGLGCIFLAWLIPSRDALENWLPILVVLIFAAQRLLPVAQQIYAAFVAIKSLQESTEAVISQISIPNSHTMLNGYDENEYTNFSGLIFDDFTPSIKPGLPINITIDQLTLEKGKIYCLWGPSGSGKTTLALNLIGVKAPYSGTISRQTKSVKKKISSKQVSSLSCLVPQNPSILNGTFLDNITLFSKPDTYGLEKIGIISSLLGIDQIAASHGQGLDSSVGEHGSLLSGGQKQRLALARAFYADRPIIMLDEITVGLDEVTKARVLNTISALSSEKIIIVITHDISVRGIADETINLADLKVA